MKKDFLNIIHYTISGISLDVPLCNDRCGVELSSQQRLVVYEYVISSNDASKNDSTLTVDLFDVLKNESTDSNTH